MRDHPNLCGCPGFMTIAPELASDDDGVFHALLDIIGVHEQVQLSGMARHRL